MPEKGFGPRPTDRGPNADWSNALRGAGLRSQFTPPRVLESREVVRHHIESHFPACRSLSARFEVCACGTALLVSCGKCGEALAVSTPPGRWCEHAAAMVGGGRGD